MRMYILDEFEDKEIYLRFVRYMLLHSDTFSLVYFKYTDSEKTKRTTKEVKELLSPYKIFAVNGNQWPSMVTLNENNHIYRITLYKAEPGAEVGLTKAEKLFDWDYPLLPMDLCFYKDGYAWFGSSGHSRYAFLYVDNEQTVEELKMLGISLQFDREINRSKLFLETSLKKVVRSFDDANHL